LTQEQTIAIISCLQNQGANNQPGKIIFSGAVDIMKVIAVNGSPRKEWNTATLLKEVLKGAESKGAETRLIHLYELNYKGCNSCFACKRTNNDLNGLCAVKDGLTGVLQEILACDALILGSPIYFGDVSGEMRSFMERLLFPNISYGMEQRSVFTGKISTRFIYTMNVNEEQVKMTNYQSVFRHNENLLQILNGGTESLFSYDTYQFKDYSQYDASRFDPVKKEKSRNEQFPLDCQRAYQMGVELTQKIFI
jgi:multimeric flavodoxin WrbA